MWKYEPEALKLHSGSHVKWAKGRAKQQPHFGDKQS